MAKGKSGGGGLLSMANIKKAGFYAAVAIFVGNWLKDKADDGTAKGSIPAKVAGALGFKGPGTAA